MDLAAMGVLRALQLLSKLVLLLGAEAKLVFQFSSPAPQFLGLRAQLERFGLDLREVALAGADLDGEGVDGVQDELRGFLPFHQSPQLEQRLGKA